MAEANSLGDEKQNRMQRILLHFLRDHKTGATLSELRKLFEGRDLAPLSSGKRDQANDDDIRRAVKTFGEQFPAFVIMPEPVRWWHKIPKISRDSGANNQRGGGDMTEQQEISREVVEANGASTEATRRNPEDLDVLVKEALKSPEESAEAFLAWAHRAEVAVLALLPRLLKGDPVLYRALGKIATGLGALGGTLFLASTGPEAVALELAAVAASGTILAAGEGVRRGIRSGRLAQFAGRVLGSFLRVPEVIAAGVEGAGAAAVAAGAAVAATGGAVALGADRLRGGMYGAYTAATEASDRFVDKAHEQQEKGAQRKLVKIEGRIDRLAEKLREKPNLRVARELQQLMREKEALRARIGGGDVVRDVADKLFHAVDEAVADGQVTREEGAQLAELAKTVSETETHLSQEVDQKKAVRDAIHYLDNRIAELKAEVPDLGNGKKDWKSSKGTECRSLIGKKGYLTRLSKKDDGIGSAAEYAKKILDEEK